jgi:ABC-type lipoprotein release transport system permease subunit
MPNAFFKAGLIVGFVGTILIGSLCTYCIHVLVSTLKIGGRVQIRGQLGSKLDRISTRVESVLQMVYTYVIASPNTNLVLQY